MLFTQFDWLLSSGYHCTIHLRTKTKWRSISFRFIQTITRAEIQTILKLFSEFSSFFDHFCFDVVYAKTIIHLGVCE